jgi:hypothetical protein
MPDARIPALTDAGLDVVPGYRIDPRTGHEDPTWRPRYFEWYENVRDWRVWAQKKFTTDSEFREHVLKLCQRSSSFFTLLFLDVEEPRSMAYFDTGVDLDTALATLDDDDDWDIAVDDLSYRTIHPFIPFAYQVEAHRDLTRVILGPKRGAYHDILWDKARGIGMSYAFLAWAYWGWVFIDGLRGTILTEKWDKAERSKDINSLFGKLDLFLDATPDVLIPDGFKEKGEKDAHRAMGRLTNPRNGAALFTEPTTPDSTRGGRGSYVGVDEINFHENLAATWATIHGTTKHCVGWSSASHRYGRQGERLFKHGKEHPGSVTVRTLDWFENPHQDKVWYEQERARFAAAGMEEQFEVEYLRNAAAGSGRLVYIKQLQLAPMTDLGYDKSKPFKLSVDPGGSDITAFIAWQTHFDTGKKVIRFVKGCQLSKVPPEFWAHVWTGILPRDAWVDDAGISHEPDPAWKYFKEGFFNESNIMDVLEFMRDVDPRSIMLYGDPAMKRADVTNESWISVFEKTTYDLRVREFGADSPNAIPIFCNLPWEILNKRNNFADRRVGMRTALMMSEFYRWDPGVLEFHEALGSTMFQKTSETSTRAPGHLHDESSHYVQAGEYGMVWETLELTPADLALLVPKEERPQRTTPSRTQGRSRYQRAHRANRRDVARDTLVGLF